VSGLGSPSFRSVVFAVAWRGAYKALTTPSIVLPTIMFPLFFFVAFAGGLSQLAQLPGFEFSSGYTAFQFCFVLLQSAAFGGVFTGFSIARDFEYGFARRLLLGAPSRPGILVGYALAALVRWAAVAILLTLVALAAGMDVSGNGIDLVGMYGLAAILNTAALLWSCGIAMRFRTMQAGPLMQLPTFLALFFAPVYVPLDLLSGWIHAIATANPITYVLEAVRGFVSGEPVYVGTAFALAVGLAAGFALWALRGLRSAERAGA